MLYNEIKHVLPEFQFEGKYQSVEELHSGNINRTYRLEYTMNGQPLHYALQYINQYVFKDPVKVMRNIERVTGHLRDRLVAEGMDPKRNVLALVPTKTGGTLCQDADGCFWRAYYFIEDATAYDQVREPRQFFEAGRGFGMFQRRLFDFPAEELYETIPDFHHSTKRFYAFVQSVADDKAGRVAELEDEIEFFFERRQMMGQIVKLLAAGKLPLRVTHNDTKVNNVMIDDVTGEAICVIDLDTVMPGSSLYDYGDAIRFGAGLRWSFMGTFLTYTLAGGNAGMRHFMAQFGPALQLPWTYLPAPELTESLIDKVVEGTSEQQGSRSIAELERYRDDCLLAVLGAIKDTKARHGFAFAE